METSGLNIGEFSDILKLFSSVTAKPEQFLSTQTAVSKQIKTAAKQLYDLTKKYEDSSSARNDSLSKLIVDQFDDEQIWQEIELQNAPVLENLVGNIANSLAAKKLSFKSRQQVDHEEEDDKNQVPDEDDSEDENDGEEEEEEDSDLDGDFTLSDGSKLGFQDIDSDEESEEEKEMKKILEKATEENVDEDFSESDEDGDLKVASEENDSMSETEFPEKKEKMKNTGSKSKRAPKRKTVVDDNFFRLADMEAFLEREDAKEERKIRLEKGDENEEEESDEDEDEDEIDMFQDMSSSEEEDEDEQNAKDFKYEEFFDPPDEDAKKVLAKSQKKSQKKKKSSKEIEEESDENSLEEDQEEDEDDEEENSEEEETKTVSKNKDLFAESDSEGEDVQDILGGRKDKQSTFEKRQQRLKTQIGKMEDASLAEKPWQLSGEVDAKSRPENSLLSEYLDFEHTTKQAPAITEETTKVLEDVIKQRIKDQAFDDVERKVKPKDDPYEFKKRVVLDQEKSKMSLSQIYEQEYIKQTQKDEEEKEDPQHEEIKKMMTSLFVKLDALSNFHYNPKPAAPEVKIVSNLPSISMEEVAPVTANDATLLAPEEIQGKPKGEVKGTTERDETDKKRQRRDKKARQRQRRKAKEQKQKLIEKTNPGLGNKFAKEKAMKDLEKQSLVKKSGVTVLKENAPSKKLGSGQFFTQLQEEVKTQIQAKKADKKKQKDKSKSSAKLKL